MANSIPANFPEFRRVRLLAKPLTPFFFIISRHHIHNLRVRQKKKSEIWPVWINQEWGHIWSRKEWDSLHKSESWQVWNWVDLDEVAHYELPHQDLRCLQIQLFWSLELKELMCIGAIPCVSLFSKGDNFYDFLSDFTGDVTRPENALSLIGRICS